MDPLKHRYSLAAVLFVCASLLIGVGCKGAADCSSDGDCFSGEQCVEGRCAVRNDSPDGGDEDAAEDTQSEDTTEDTAEDTGGEDSGDTSEMDVADDAGDSQTQAPSCVVDKFTASCPDDLGEPNESTTSGYDLNGNSPIGCLNDEFKPLSETHSTWLCANETQDWYDVTYYPCEDTTFRIEATFTPATDCDRELFAARLANNDCSDADVSCGWEGDSYVIRKLVETNSVGSAFKYYFGIEKFTDSLSDQEEVQLEYDVTFETVR